MGEAIDSAVFSAADFENYGALVKLERDIAWERLTSRYCPEDPWHRDGQKVGREKEYVLVDADTGLLAHVAQAILDAMAGPYPDTFHTELGPFNIEVGSTVVSKNGTPITLMAREERKLRRLLEPQLRKHNARLGSFGVVPCITEADLQNIMGDARYLALMEQFDRNHGPYHIHIKVQGFGELCLRGNGIAPEACTTTAQLHEDMCAENMLRRLNTRQWISPVLVGLSGWGGHAFGQLLCRGDLRHLIFPQSIRLRGRRHQKGWYRHRMDPIDWALAEPVLIPTIKGQRPEELRELMMAMGTNYPPSVRLVLNQNSLRSEGRDRPAAATIRDTSGDDALEMALMAHEEPFMDDRIAAGLPFTVVRRNLASAARFGATAPIRMVRRDGKLEWTTPAQWVRQHDEALYHALVSTGVTPGEAAYHLAVPFGRARKNFTPTDWLIAASHRVPDLGALTLAAMDRADSDLPVSEWDLP